MAKTVSGLTSAFDHLLPVANVRVGTKNHPRQVLATAQQHTVVLHRQLNLCEGCFFQAVANLKQERRTQALFSDDGRADRAIVGDDFGLIPNDSFMSE